jgi:hypothetical protein
VWNVRSLLIISSNDKCSPWIALWTTEILHGIQKELENVHATTKTTIVHRFNYRCSLQRSLIISENSEWIPMIALNFLKIINNRIGLERKTKWYLFQERKIDFFLAKIKMPMFRWQRRHEICWRSLKRNRSRDHGTKNNTVWSYWSENWILEFQEDFPERARQEFSTVWNLSHECIEILNVSNNNLNNIESESGQTPEIWKQFEKGTWK